MPVIEIQALVAGEPDRAVLLTDVATEAAKALEIDERYCWATFRPIESGGFFEGGRIRFKEDAHHVSPIVRISLYQGHGARQKGRLLASVAQAVARHLGVPMDNVYVELCEIPKGHVFAGGKVL